MKFQTIVTATIITALATPMAVKAGSREDYENLGVHFCSKCEYDDVDDILGGYLHKEDDGTPCIIDLTKCKTKSNIPDINKLAESSECIPFEDYHCCEDSNAEVLDINESSIWSVENDKWCIIKTLKTFTEVDMMVTGWVDLLSNYYLGSEDHGTQCDYNFTLYNIDTTTFFETYEIEYMMINDNVVSTDEIYLDQDKSDVFHVESNYYDKKETNKIKLLIKNKKTDTRYLIELPTYLFLTE